MQSQQSASHVSRREAIALGTVAAGTAFTGSAAARTNSAIGTTPTHPRNTSSSAMADVNLIAADAGERLEVGPTRLRILEDGSRTDNRFGAIASILPAGVAGPPQHRHLMHEETFLVTGGILRFTLGETHHDARMGDYVVVPVGAPHTFANVSAAPVEFFSTFTPAYYVNYFRELAALVVKGPLKPEDNIALMLRYATVPY